MTRSSGTGRAAAAVLLALGATAWVAGSACSDRSLPTAATPPTITVDTSRRHQTIDGFGAAATGLWEPKVRETFANPDLARLVIDDLGASIIRVGLPPDLIPVDDPAPEHLDAEAVKAAAFFPPGDFLKAAAERAKDRGTELRFIGTFWTPAPWMKSNNSPKDGGTLRADRSAHFAKLCGAACVGFEKAIGRPLEALSIQNEPAFVEPYESCVYTPVEYAATLKTVGAAFTAWNIKTRLFGPEDVGADPKRFARYVDAAMANPDPGNLGIIALHGYAGDGVSARSNPGGWEKMRDSISPLARPLWMTETSGHEATWRGRTTRDADRLPRPGALDLATAIHDALVHGGVSAWVYWEITDVRERADQSLMILMEPTPKFYAAKQYFRYIRPGAVRVEASSIERDVLASAFLHEKDRTLTIVVINRTTKPREVALRLGNAAPIDSFETIRSSAAENAVSLAATPIADGAGSIVLPPESVVTLRDTLRQP